jgi:hypothetical protein
VTHLVYLAIAYGIIWGLVFLYLIQLSLIERDPSRQVCAMEEAVAREQFRGGGDTPTSQKME